MLPTPTAGRQMFSLAIDPMTMQEVVDYCTAAVDKGVPTVIGVVNAAKVVSLQTEARLADAMTDCDLVLADGQAVVWAARLLRRPLPERVAGIDLFLRLLSQADERGWSVYFLGATREVLDDLLARVGRDFPRVHVAGARDGYFSDSESAEVAAQIEATAPDLLFVGMSSPRKELFLRTYGHRIVHGVCHGVGGSFDVFAGHTKRAPLLWQRTGFEWLYRVLQEPRRLWRRYLFSNLAFARLLVHELRTRGVAAQPQPAVARRGVARDLVPEPRQEVDNTGDDAHLQRSILRSER